MGINRRLTSSTNLFAYVRDLVVDYSADNTGATNVAAKFANFNTDAVGVSGRVKLTAPAGTFKVTPSGAMQFWASGLLNYVLEGAGIDVTYITHDRTGGDLSSVFYGSTGQYNDNTHYAKFATVSAGATSVTLLTPAEASRFTVGKGATPSGIDTQGVIDGEFGFPSNNHFFDHVIVTAKDAGTGVVDFDRAIGDSYKSTWPQQGVGSAFATPQGGPGMLFAMRPEWNATVVVKDLTINDSGQIVYTGKARNVTFQRVKFVGTYGPGPSENEVVSLLSCVLTGNSVEVDKFVSTLIVDGCTGPNKLWFQSSATKLLTLTNTTMTFLSGTPRRAVIDLCTIADMRPGANSYGASESVAITNSTVSAFSSGSYNDTIAGLAMASGIIKAVKRLAVTAFADNGSGFVRLTVASTADVATGQTLSASGVFVTGGQNTGYAITIVDGTHIDLLTRAFSGTTWTGSGNLVNLALRWAIPGRWINLLGTGGTYGNFQVVDIYDDATYTYVSTNLAGGWPTGTTSISPHPCSSWTASNNTGCPEIIEHSMSYAQNKPIFCYANRTYDKTLATNNTVQPTVYGALTDTAAISVNVTTAYTGPTGTLTWRPTQFATQFRVLRSGTVTTMDFTINAKITGNRVYNGATQTWSGAQSGDVLPVLQAGDRLIGTHVSAPCLSTNVSADNAGPVIVYEVKANQGI